MAGRHAVGHHHVHVPGDSPVHRLAPEAKLVGLGLFVASVALVPPRAVGVYAVDGLVLAAVVAVACLSPRLVASRVAVVAPFVVFALFIPFVADGEQTELLGVSMSVDGLWSAGDIVAKALLGATATLLVSATTPLPDLMAGLARLRVPPVMVAIAAFMFRYLDLQVDQLRRMRAAMTARGHDPRWLWQARPVASSAGVLFVRSYERGERIHQAMLARGFTGAMPELEVRRPDRSDWWVAGLPAVVALAATTSALVLS